MLHGDGRSLAYGAPTGSIERLVVMLVLFLPAEERLVDLGFAVEGGLAFVRGADAVEHEPRRLLRDLEFPVETHRGDALQARQIRIDGDRPLPQRNLGTLENGGGAYREVAPAVRAPVGHGLGLGDFGGLQPAAARAAPLAVPDRLLEPASGGGFVREHVGKLDEADAFAVVLVGCPALLGNHGDFRLVDDGGSTPEIAFCVKSSI